MQRYIPGGNALCWPEYGSELLGTALLVFSRSARSPSIWVRAAAGSCASQEQRASVNDRAHTHGKRAERFHLASWQAERWPSQPGSLAGVLATGKIMLMHDLACYLASHLLGGRAHLEGVGSMRPEWGDRPRDGIFPLEHVFARDGAHLPAGAGDFSLPQQPSLDVADSLMTWIFVAFIPWLAAPISGSSLNLARSFDPALSMHFHACQSTSNQDRFGWNIDRAEREELSSRQEKLFPHRKRSGTQRAIN